MGNDKTITKVGKGHLPKRGACGSRREAALQRIKDPEISLRVTQETPVEIGLCDDRDEIRSTSDMGQNADVRALIGDVRFTPKSGHASGSAPISAKCPLQPRGDHHSRYPIFH